METLQHKGPKEGAEENNFKTHRMIAWFDEILGTLKRLSDYIKVLEEKVAALENKELVDNPDIPLVGGDNPDLPLFGGMK